MRTRRFRQPLAAPLPWAREVEAFLAERQRLGLSPSYLASQRRALGRLAESMAARARPVTLSVVTEGDLLAAVAAERSRGLAPGTLHTYQVAYRGFFGWLSRRGRILLDPARNLSGPQPPRRLGYVPTPEEVERLLAACDLETDRGLMDRAVLELLYGSGLRLGEVRNLDVGDLDLAGRTAFIKNAKGRKDRIVPLTEKAAETIARYLAHVRPASTQPVLFASPTTGGRFEPASWRKRRLRPLLEEAGLPLALTPHRLRHACAVHLLAGGADLRQIQKLLGHASIETTEVYLQLDGSSLARVLERAHPAER